MSTFTWFLGFNENKKEWPECGSGGSPGIFDLIIFPMQCGPMSLYTRTIHYRPDPRWCVPLVACAIGKPNFFLSALPSLNKATTLKFYLVTMGRLGQKWDLVVTSDWGVLLTHGQRVWTAFCKIFPGTPYLTTLIEPKHVLQIPYLAMFGIFGSIYECAKWVSECRLWVYNAENYSSDSSYLWKPVR